MPPRSPKTIENLLLKPYFWRRPSQLPRRAVRALWPSPGHLVVKLPWGLEIECRRGELIGDAIARTGVFEMATTEALARLVDPGDLVLDVGANIGYMTSVLATAAGPRGRVLAYEPNPSAYERLAANVERWPQERLATIELRQVAVSDHEGDSTLAVPRDGSEWAALGDRPGRRAAAGPFSSVSVNTVTLDGELASLSVGVLKLDVEDHEPAVLSGARSALDQRLIRDIVFEDHASYPSDATVALEMAGYSVFDLTLRPLGVALAAASESVEYASWDAPMRLATADPIRARQRFLRRGWVSLSAPSRWPIRATGELIEAAIEDQR